MCVFFNLHFASSLAPPICARWMFARAHGVRNLSAGNEICMTTTSYRSSRHVSRAQGLLQGRWTHGRVRLPRVQEAVGVPR